jgi:hypothetical protein
MLKDTVLNSSAYSLFIAIPAVEYIDLYDLLNSNDELARLSGYYGLLNGLLDDDFLIKRYKIEDNICSKRTIIWLLRHSANTGKVLQFYKSEYGKSDIIIKNEILRGMKRLDIFEYRSFIRTRFADKVSPIKESEFILQESY